MKKLIISLFFIVLFISCKNKDDSNKKTNENLLSEVKNDSYIISQKLLGVFIGVFGKNPMILLISKITNDSISGSSVIAGNESLFVGTVVQKDGTFNIRLQKPGDNTNEGLFNFIIDEKNADAIKASWIPDNKGAENMKTFILQRKPFTYNTNVGEYQASKKILHVADVENLLKDELEIMRNEIFARHGFCFSNKTLRQYFESQEWYVPNSYNVRNDLTEIEKKNIALIKRYETYADEYGDDFGR